MRKQERRARRWCVMDLITDPVTGRLAETKLWANIGKALMCWVLWNEATQGQVTESLLMWFGLLLFAHESVSRFLINRHDIQTQDNTDGTKTVTATSQTVTAVSSSPAPLKAPI